VNRRQGSCAAFAATVALLGACSTPPRDALTSCQQTLQAKTDILFVVDDSGSMASKQQNLADNFQAFIGWLDQFPVKNDYQIGITTTSVDRYAGTLPVPDTFDGTGNPVCPNPPYPPNTNQNPQAAQATDTVYPKGALVSVSQASFATGAAGRVQSTANPSSPPRILSAGSPTLVADFTQNVYVGVCGSGKEQGLEAMSRALSEPLLSGANAGFRRPGARLAVIIVSDDDDCSDPDHQGTSLEPTACTSKPVDDYVNFAKGLGDVVVGAIIAVDPSTLQPAQCTVQNPDGSLSSVTAEHPAPRYKAFADAFQDSVVDSVCNASFHDALQKIANLIGQTLQLSGAPADPGLLTVRVNKASGDSILCQVGLAGDASANVRYAPPTSTNPASLTFSGSCTLQQGDQVDVKVLCAG
jgi:hypothetical protein